MKANVAGFRVRCAALAGLGLGAVMGGVSAAEVNLRVNPTFEARYAARRRPPQDPGLRVAGVGIATLRRTQDERLPGNGWKTGREGAES